MRIEKNRRILVVDDDEDVRKSYRGILVSEKEEDVFSMGRELFTIKFDKPQSLFDANYELSMADNGIDAIALVKRAVAEDCPFAVAFIDMKMPGIDGAETSAKIWEIDPAIKIVIVTAYSDYSPEDIIAVTGRKDIFYLRKPFNSEEIIQFARTLTSCWDFELREKMHLEFLEDALLQQRDEINAEKQKSEKIKKEKTALIKYISCC